MSGYKIRVEPSGQEFHATADQTVLEAALAAGISLPYGCRDGACGSCRGRVLSGQVQHRPHAAAALDVIDEQSGHALFCCALAQGDLIIEARVATVLDGVVPRKLPARIEGIDWPASDVAVLRLKLPASEALRYRAGQYVDFLLAQGVRRSYSIASAPGSDGPLEFHVRHMPGGAFTDALFAQSTPALRARGILRIEAPLGGFYLRADASQPIVLLASGTGFAPLKAIAETIFAQALHRDDPARGRAGRSVALYWGGRTQADLYMDALPRRWAATEPNFRYVPVLSEPGAPAGATSSTPSVAPASELDPAASHLGSGSWTGRIGLVHRAVMEDVPDLSGYHVYACGAPAMVAAAQRDFMLHCGLRRENFFADAFVSRADLTAV